MQIDIKFAGQITEEEQERILVASMKNIMAQSALIQHSVYCTVILKVQSNQRIYNPIDLTYFPLSLKFNFD